MKHPSIRYYTPDRLGWVVLDLVADQWSVVHSYSDSYVRFCIAPDVRAVWAQKLEEAAALLRAADAAALERGTAVKV